MIEPAGRYISLAQFMIDGDNDPSDQRREWIDGEVYLMPFATPEHGSLCANMGGVLSKALRNKCVIRDGSVGVYIPTTRAALCPDVTAVCGPLLRLSVESNGKVVGQAIENPCVIVEVLSDSTEHYERATKSLHYRAISWLEEYVLVSQMTRRIEVFRRANDWKCDVVENTGTFVIHGATLSLDDIYAMPNIEA